jgi:hypothetical protein
MTIRVYFESKRGIWADLGNATFKHIKLAV